MGSRGRAGGDLNRSPLKQVLAADAIVKEIKVSRGQQSSRGPGI